MAEYTPQIDAYIASLLAAGGPVGAGDLAGLEPQAARELLQRYALEHQYDASAPVFDGVSLRSRSAGVPAAVQAQIPAEAPAVAPAVAPAAPFDAALPVTTDYGFAPSPVDIALQAGPSALDTKPSQGKVGLWAWLLPTSLLLPGGILAWFLFKGTNRRIAAALFWTGVAMTVVTIATLPLMAPAMKQAGGALPGGVGNAPSGSAAWPASGSGLPDLYYFGATGSKESQAMVSELASIQGQYDGKVDFNLYPDTPNSEVDKAFATTHAVTQFPTTVLVGGDSKEQQRWTGVVPVAQLQHALDSSGP